MAITTLDGAIAGMKPAEYYAKALTGTLVGGRPHSLFYGVGIPGAAAAPTPGIGGASLTTYAGQIPVPANSNITYLSRFSGAASAQGGMLLLCDRLWHNSAVANTSTANQVVSSTAWPARDADGSTNGRGVYIGLEFSGAGGAGTPTLELTYTNSTGANNRITANTLATSASPIVGTFFPLGLQAGDVGVRQVQGFKLSATWTSGVMHLVAYRVIASLELAAGGLPNAVDALTSGMPKLYDGTVPFLLFIPQTTTTTQVAGTVVYTQG